MYIKNIVIDGFKSYAQRTEICDWDPLFNAITGLNGSGKSNILDAVCFVLGISNLSQVRAANLQELVYKNGQAGVTKATVSITFDNRDKKQSPLGFESNVDITVTRQVVIGGRNKYLINGVNATTARVQDLFRSVGLNVNNPHFLIMQGRITKVLNMKPPEILAIIEEAAGTRMYESKKLSAQKTIEKKEAKLKEINEVLDEEISPTLEKLKQERASYLEFDKLCRELECLRRLVTAHQFWAASERRDRSATELRKLQAEEGAAKEEMERVRAELARTEVRLREMEVQRDKEGGGELSKMEEVLTEAQRSLVKIQSAADIRTEALRAEKERHAHLLATTQAESQVIESKRAHVTELEVSLAALTERCQSAARALSEAQARFAAASVGLSVGDAEEDGGGPAASTLAEQTLRCREEISQAESEHAQAEMSVSHAERELTRLSGERGCNAEAYAADEKALGVLRGRSQALAQEMHNLGYTEGELDALLQRRKLVMGEEATLGEKIDSLLARTPHLHFNYGDPEPGWDRLRVHGLVAMLVRVDDKWAATALEVVAGGKLYHVVTDTELTGKLLLERGSLRRRVTIIPLNKISATTLSTSVVSTAKKIDADVRAALSLVSARDPCDAPAVGFVFGGALVCPSLDSARHVAFHPAVMTRCVTTDGDSFSPHGTLTGGARAQVASILLSVEELLSLQQQLQDKEEELRQLATNITTLTTLADKHRQLRQREELLNQEMEHLQQKLELSTHHKLTTQIATLTKSIESLKETARACVERRDSAAGRLRSLEERRCRADSERQHQMQAATGAMETHRERAASATREAGDAHQVVCAARLELEELEREAGCSVAELRALENSSSALETLVAQMRTAAQEQQASVSECQGRVEEAKRSLRAQHEAVCEAAHSVAELKAAEAAASLALTQMQHAVTLHHRDTADNSNKVESLLRDNEWIATERSLFGRPNTAYDFASHDPRKAAQRLASLEQTRQKMSLSVNKRATNLLAQAEEKYVDVMKKKRIVENDKMKIYSTMEELDHKKHQALHLAWTQVNEDFSSIFSTLLPGSQAKLTPIESTTSSSTSSTATTPSLLQGLEFRVALGAVWKENLSELSGGQRSLVALSLILAMLLFKPAPIYILDEVDAALDLSHTQNIGHMLRTHFLTSQFVVVSLKDGMFNNANVLFKTRFVEGLSTVTRHANSSTTTTRRHQQQNTGHKQRDNNAPATGVVDRRGEGATGKERETRI